MLKDNTQSIWILGHNAEVNREGTDYATLQVRIRDTDYYNQYIEANYSGRIWVTVNGTGTGSWDDGYWNSTDSNGYLTIQFNPDCSPLYKAGYQDWRGGIDFNDTCYKQVNSTDRNVSVKGQLKNYLEIPQYGNQTVVGDPLDVRFNVSTDCNELIPNTTASVEFGAPDNWWNESYTPTDEGTGWYNYTWDTSFHIGGWWDIRINSSIDYYNSNTTTWDDWVYLENTPPNITSANVTPSSGGWGTIFEYSVNIYDDQQDNVTCSLYVSTNNGTSYSMWNETIIYGGQDWCNLTISTFNCSHMNSDENDTNYFYFKIDDETNVNYTNNITGPFIIYDPVNITYIFGNGSQINRPDSMANNSATLIVYVNDTLKNESVVPGTEVTFWVTYNGSEWDTGNQTYTNGSGYAIDDFNPGCSHPIFTYYRVGNQTWTAEVTDSCYENINLSSNYSLTIYGKLQNEIDLPPLGQTYERVNENISVRGLVRDDCLNTLLEANATFNFTHEGGTEYDCWPTTNQTIYYECTRNTTGMFARWYNTTMYANYTDHYDNITTTGDHFFIKTKPFLYNATALIDPGGWGERFYFFVNITDEDLDNVTVNLYTRKYGAASWGSPKNSTWIEAPVNESIVLSWRDDTCDNIDIWEFYFEGVDNRSLSNDSKIYNFTVEKDEVNFTMIFGDNEEVWRNGTDNLTFVVYVYDTDRDAIVASGSNASFWVTMNASDPNSWDSGFTTYVNGSSYINYEFPTYVPEPTECNYTVGVQEWKAGTGGVNEDKCYMSMNSTEYNITINANLIPQIISPNGEGFLWGTPIPIVGYMEDDCYPVEDIEVRWQFYLDPNTYTRYQDPANQSNGWYNYTWLDTEKSPGYYEARMQANYNNQNPYYGYNDTIKPDAFFIALAPSITDYSIDKTLAGWGEENTFSVRINDPDLNENNITLWKRLWNASAKVWENWTLVDNKSIDQLTNVWVDFIERFTCSDMGINEYRFDTIDEFNFSDSTYNDLTNVSGKLIHNASDNVLENISKTIHTATEDSGFNYSEQINTSGAMEYFNITIENTDNQTL
ncbi:MAG: hypothetical protein JSW41_04170, partial [Candidatus Aenigmatarchaeota archaeon]